MLSQKNSLGAKILANYGLNQNRVQFVLSFNRRESLEKASKGSLLSEQAKSVLDIAFRTAQRFNHAQVDTSHLLYGIVSQRNSNSDDIFSEFNLDPEKIKKQIESLFNHMFADIEGLGFEPVTTTPRRSSRTPALDYFSVDLTALAAQDKLDPVIGREKEIERLIQILGRRTKNNPVLIGDPGVGKTAIVEGLAIRIVQNKVPSTLLGKRILSIDLASMLAGTKYRGEFESRIKKVLDEAKKSKDIILFIDEFHTVVGAGAAEGAMDAANILKPALSRGEIRCIGATTVDEYRKYIEKDAALERRFQPIQVSEATVEETIEILKGLKHKYEEFHGVKFTDQAIEQAAKLSKRYISDRFLPDKAIDLIDEAASKARAKEADSAETKELVKKLEKAKSGKEKAVAAQDYEMASKFRDIEVKLKDKIAELRAGKGGKIIIIDTEEIAEVVSSWTGIPVTRLVETEAQRLLHIDKVLKQRIIGQEEAVEAVAQAIRRSRVGITSEKRPIGSFIFLGPTGVGKTELAKVLASYVFESEEALIKLDMSEFMEKHNVSRLVGAPPGYVGYEESGKLTEAVRRHPHSVVLLDEIEKAHPDVFNILLQILEDGYLTDAKGKKVDFRNTIIIMTSNIGVADLNRQASFGFKAKSRDEKKEAESRYNEIKKNILEQLKRNFRPEFLNRVDKIIVFKPLSKVAIRKIVDLQISDLQNRLKEKEIALKLTNKALGYLAQQGFDPENGARPLRRVIQDTIEEALSVKMLDGEIKEGDGVKVDLKKGKLVLVKI